jgi:acyl carrier protein
VEAEDLRQHLLATLPDYMLPSVFLRAKALPLNRHGKLDRRALADLEATRLGAGEYEPPRNAVEETLARVWAEKLGLERVGIHDNYFNLGGDSVKAISLLAALNRELGCDVRIPALYEHKTVAELARQVTKSAGADQTVARAGARAVSEEMEALRQRILGR